MGDASVVIYKLKPVTHRFKEQDVDPNKGPQPQNLDYGLIAEDVAEIDPKLAIRDAKGQIESLRYVAIYNIMLNEFLKEHGRIQAQQSKIEKQEATITELKFNDCTAAEGNRNCRFTPQRARFKNPEGERAV
jgi:hypothetical protein